MDLQGATGALHQAQEQIVAMSHDSEARTRKLQALADFSRGVTATLLP
jgi:hypothetical protein